MSKNSCKAAESAIARFCEWRGLNCYDLQKVIDHILAFWGIVDDMIDCENVRNMIKTGKRVERLDLFGRLQMDEVSILREVHRLAGRIKRTNLHYDTEKLEELEELISMLENPENKRLPDRDKNKSPAK